MIKYVQKRKSQGTDRFNSRVIKEVSETAGATLNNLQTFFMKKQGPKGWKRGNIYVINKKRGISVTLAVIVQ